MIATPVASSSSRGLDPIGRAHRQTCRCLSNAPDAAAHTARNRRRRLLFALCEHAFLCLRQRRERPQASRHDAMRLSAGDLAVIATLAQSGFVILDRRAAPAMSSQLDPRRIDTALRWRHHGRERRHGHAEAVAQSLRVRAKNRRLVLMRPNDGTKTWRYRMKPPSTFRRTRWGRGLPRPLTRIGPLEVRSGPFH